MEDVTNPPRISLIAALSLNFVIGCDNRLPWHLPEDLQYFKKTTGTHPVIMGRRTYESIGRVLPRRRNIIISPSCHQQGKKITGAEVVESLQNAVALCHNETDIFIIGGEQVFKDALPLAQRLYLTEIHHFFVGDTFFPSYNKWQWKVLMRESHTSPAGLKYDFVIYEKCDPVAASDVPKKRRQNNVLQFRKNQMSFAF